MSEIVDLLNKSAELEKQAYYDYVKAFASSGISSLVSGGVGFEKAAQLMKTACEQDPKIINLGMNANAFEKAAEYVAELEDKVTSLEKIAGQYEHQEIIETSEPLQKLASIGFTQEDIEFLSTLPENLLEKVASSNSAPWELGSGVGMAREKTDPLLDFIMS